MNLAKTGEQWQKTGGLRPEHGKKTQQNDTQNFQKKH